MRTLVTGGAGFIGSHLVDKLVDMGHAVVVVDNLSHGKKSQVHPAALFCEKDIVGPALEEVFEKERPHAVFHLAAEISVRKSLETPIQDAKTNILGSLNLFEQCRKFGVQKIVFASTGGAMYGDAEVIPTPEFQEVRPLSPYGVAKRAAEEYLEYYQRSFGVPFVALRLANVYGPRQDGEGEAGVVAIFKKALERGVPPTIFGDGRQTRDFVFVEDVVAAHVAALEKPVGGIFNIGTGKETPVGQLLEHMQHVVGSRLAPAFAEPKAGELQKSCLHIAKAKKELGWSPRYALQEGLKKTIAHVV